MTMHVQTEINRHKWDELVDSLSGHPLQLWGWGEVKAAHNWRVDRVIVRQDDAVVGGAQLLIRSLPAPFRTLVYLPRGPVVAEKNAAAVLEAIVDYACKHYQPVAVSIEPDWTDMPEVKGWRRAKNTILIPRTLILDLKKHDDELLAHMTKKTRQYIRKSANDGVTVRQITEVSELQKCLEIYHQTAERAGFALHGDDYYFDIIREMGEQSPVFAAFYDSEIVAFLWLAKSQTTAFELYGGMNDTGQRVRANYALKWEVIRQMKACGVTRYDMNGLLNDGVSTFKQGFADHEDMLAGTYDRPLSPLYAAWVQGLPLAKKVIRLIKK